MKKYRIRCQVLGTVYFLYSYGESRDYVETVIRALNTLERHFPPKYAAVRTIEEVLQEEVNP